MKRAYIGIVLALLSLPFVTSISALYAACCGEDSFMSRPRAQGICNWEQGDGRCDTDGDCCPGRKCSAFGICESC